MRSFFYLKHYHADKLFKNLTRILKFDSFLSESRHFTCQLVELSFLFRKFENAKSTKANNQ